VTLLRLRGVTTYYGEIRILEDVSLEVGSGELVCLLGGNASGKSTTLKTILGLVHPRSGVVEFDGRDVTQLTTSRRIALGMAIVPENRRLFAPLTVEENLELGAYLRNGDVDEARENVFELFPRLRERRTQVAGTLSGGEQQMVAMGRALMSEPRLLLMDEPSMGLAPSLVRQNFEIIRRINESGVAVLVVEQNANISLRIADRGYVLQTGSIVLADSASRCSRARTSGGPTWAAEGPVRPGSGRAWRGRCCRRRPRTRPALRLRARRARPRERGRRRPPPPPASARRGGAPRRRSRRGRR